MKGGVEKTYIFFPSCIQTFPWCWAGFWGSKGMGCVAEEGKRQGGGWYGSQSALFEQSRGDQEEPLTSHWSPQRGPLKGSSMPGDAVF